MELKPLFLALGAILLVGCGATPREPVNFGPGLGATTRVDAPAPTATYYATDSVAEASILGGARVEEVRASILRAATEAGVAMEGDGRLAVLAGWLAERLGPNGALPPVQVIQFFARHLGIAEPAWNQFLVAEPTPERFYAAVQSATSHYVLDTHDNRYGAAVFQRDGLTFALVVLTQRHLALTSIARTQALNSTLHVRGEVRDGFTHPTVIVTGPDGQTDEHPASSGTTFDVPVSLRARGVYQLEVMGDAGHGAVVLANMPVYVGVHPPASIEIRPVAVSSEPETETSVEDALLSQINATRASFGLPALVRDTRVDAIARGHSEDMRDHSFIAHISPTTGSPSDRIARSGLHTSLGAENIGRAYTAAEIHEGLLDSPGHRANILLRDATHLGIGVVSIVDAGRVAYIATEVFVRLAQPIDVATAPSVLLSEVNAARSGRGLSALTPDPALQGIAMDAARAALADTSMSNSQVVAGASRELDSMGARFSRGVAVMTVVPALHDAASMDPFFQTEMLLVGVGIAQGDRAGSGPNSIVVVLVFAAPR